MRSHSRRSGWRRARSRGAASAATPSCVPIRRRRLSPAPTHRDCRRLVCGDTRDGANWRRAVTTSHRFCPHRPLSRRRRATSATASCPRSGLVAGFEVDRRAEAQRVGGRLRQDVRRQPEDPGQLHGRLLAPLRRAAMLPPPALREDAHTRYGMACWGGRQLSGCLEPGRWKPRGMAGSAGARLFRQGESVRTVTVLDQTPAERRAEAIDSFGFLKREALWRLRPGSGTRS